MELYEIINLNGFKKWIEINYKNVLSGRILISTKLDVKVKKTRNKPAKINAKINASFGQGDGGTIEEESEEETNREGVRKEDEDRDSFRNKAIGMLRLKVIRARLSHDTETFGKMDPYFQV
jgi:alpha-mannosidase